MKKYDRILERVRVITKGRGVPSRVIRLSNLKDVRKERVEDGSLSRVAIG